MTSQPDPAPASPQPAPTAAPAAADAFIGIDDFSKVVLKTAIVEHAENHPNADKLLKLTVLCGTERRTICAGIRAWWKPEDLVGKTIIIVANLAPRMMRGVESQGMMLAVTEAGGTAVTPLTTINPASHGLRVS